MGGKSSFKCMPFHRNITQPRTKDVIIKKKKGQAVTGSSWKKQKFNQTKLVIPGAKIEISVDPEKSYQPINVRFQ